MTLTDVTDEQPEQPKPTPTEAARDHLATIRKGWRHVLDPINVERGGSTRSEVRAATEDDLELPPDARLDTPLTLAFWVRAAIDEWPLILQTLQPDPTGQLILTTTETIDCTDVPAMCRLLDREAARLTEWVDEMGRNFGESFCEDLEQLARAVARVAWPPKGDRLTIGECPDCGRRVRVKAPAWIKRPMPHPTTDPTTYPAWAVVPESPWEPARDRPITCRCGREGTLREWRDELTGTPEPMTAAEITDQIRARLGLRYEAVTVRQWARRGLIRAVDKSPEGHSRYDLEQVLAALMAREKQRDSA